MRELPMKSGIKLPSLPPNTQLSMQAVSVMMDHVDAYAVYIYPEKWRDGRYWQSLERRTLIVTAPYQRGTHIAPNQALWMRRVAGSGWRLVDLDEELLRDWLCGRDSAAHSTTLMKEFLVAMEEVFNL